MAVVTRFDAPVQASIFGDIGGFVGGLIPGGGAIGRAAGEFIGGVVGGGPSEPPLGRPRPGGSAFARRIYGATTTSFAPQEPVQEPIVQGDINPCPPGYIMQRNEGIFGGGTTTCVPTDYPSPIAAQPYAPVQLPAQQPCGCTSLATQTCDLGAGRRGYLNKTQYFLTGRDTFGTFVPRGSRCVKRRKMNYGNVKALRRSIRRASGFDRLVKANRKALRKLASI